MTTPAMRRRVALTLTKRRRLRAAPSGPRREMRRAHQQHRAECRSILVVELADVMLRIKFNPKPGDELDLRLEIIDDFGVALHGAVLSERMFLAGQIILRGTTTRSSE